MSRNLKLGLVIAAIAVGGFLLVQSQSKTIAPTKSATENSAQPKESESDSATSTTDRNEHIIILGVNGFDPPTITVSKGERVIWENKSGDMASVNSDDHPTHQKFPQMNLGEFMDTEHANGKRLELVFETPGIYDYHDHLHPERRGTVVVE